MTDSILFPAEIMAGKGSEDACNDIIRLIMTKKFKLVDYGETISCVFGAVMHSMRF